MKIVHSKTNCYDIKFESINKKVSVSMKSTNGPEVCLEDGSRLLFTNPVQHFRVMTDSDISSSNTDINIDKLGEKYFVNEDDVSFVNYDRSSITEVTEYKILGEPVYKLMLI